MITGYVSNPSLTRSTSRTIRLFVNQRMISDNGIVSAIFRGFQGRIMKGRFPMAVLFITLPFDEVDVNVHPAKLMVRFADQNHIYSMVVDAVNEALCRFEKKIFAGSFNPGIQEKTDVIEQVKTEFNDVAGSFSLKPGVKDQTAKSRSDIKKFEKKVEQEKKRIAESSFTWQSPANKVNKKRNILDISNYSRGFIIWLFTI